MVGVVTMVLLTAQPESSVVIARRLGLEPARGTELAQQLVDTLVLQPHPFGRLVGATEANERLAKAGFPDTAVCNGATACIASLAKVGGFDRLISLQLVKLGPDLAVDASVVEESSGVSLAVVTRTVRAKSIADDLVALANELISKLPVHAPKTASATRLPSAARAELEPRRGGWSTNRWVALGLGGAGVVALGVGLALGISANAQANRLSVLDPSYEANVASVRQSALLADLGFVTAGAFAVAALVTWLLGT